MVGPACGPLATRTQ